MSAVKTITLAQLGGVLRAFPKKMHEASVRGMAKSTVRVRAAIREEIAAAKPVPIDTKEYLDGWKVTKTPKGAKISNSSPQALWVEQGRRAGPVGPEGIRRLAGWVRRKGIYTHALAQIQASSRTNGKSVRKRDAVEQACLSVAYAIAQKLLEKGVEPRHILRRAIARSGGGFIQALDSELQKVQL